MSPVLFSLFLNDLEEYLTESQCKGINLNNQENDVDTYLKLLVLLYADDNVVFCTNAESFQHNLNAFYEFS